MLAFSLKIVDFYEDTNFDLIHTLMSFKCRNQNSPKN